MNAPSYVQSIPLQTSVMGPIDRSEPDVEDILHLEEDGNRITRKTKDNIMKEAHEPRSEEFVWYFLFPYGKMA